MVLEKNMKYLPIYNGLAQQALILMYLKIREIKRNKNESESNAELDYLIKKISESRNQLIEYGNIGLMAYGIPEIYPELPIIETIDKLVNENPEFKKKVEQLETLDIKYDSKQLTNFYKEIGLAFSDELAKISE